MTIVPSSLTKASVVAAGTSKVSVSSVKPSAAQVTVNAGIRGGVEVGLVVGVVGVLGMFV